MKIKILEEHKINKDEKGNEKKVFYYPLCTYSFDAVRDPRSKIFSMFFPTTLLGGQFIRGFDPEGAFEITKLYLPFFILLQMLCYLGIIINMNIMIINKLN